jgi:hypothetical protein
MSWTNSIHSMRHSRARSMRKQGLTASGRTRGGTGYGPFAVGCRIREASRATPGGNAHPVLIASVLLPLHCGQTVTRGVRGGTHRRQPTVGCSREWACHPKHLPGCVPHGAGLKLACADHVGARRPGLMPGHRRHLLRLRSCPWRIQPAMAKSRLGRAAELQLNDGGGTSRLQEGRGPGSGRSRGPARTAAQRLP